MQYNVNKFRMNLSIFKVLLVISCVQNTGYCEHYIWGRERRTGNLPFSGSFIRNLDYDYEFVDVGSPLILTPFIKKKLIKSAKTLSLVNPSIGQWLSYSGYLTVNESCGSNIFFWFIPAKKNWRTAPVLAWLQGGPGSGSLYGLFEEIGPFNHFSNGLVDRKFTWNTDNNIIYIDQPVGSGYSFSVKKCYPETMARVTDELYSFLTQFFQLFPELVKNRFFLTGESFAGHYIPALATHIHRFNPRAQIKINLAGILIANPLIKLSCHDYATFLFEWGVIGASVRKKIFKMQRNLKSHANAGQYENAWDDWDFIMNDLVGEKLIPNRECMVQQPPDESDYMRWVATPAVRKQLHVGDTEYNDQNWDVYNQLIKTIPESMTSELEVLLEARNYSIGFFSGNLDMVCMTTSTECVLDGLRWWGLQEYLDAKRKPFTVDGEKLAGWFKMAGPLYLVIVKDSGHCVPAYQPEVSHTLITKATKAPPGVNPVTLFDLFLNETATF